MAKAVAWWLALCGKLGIKSVEDLLWAKFPAVCPYCKSKPHDPDACRSAKRERRGPDWRGLSEVQKSKQSEKPKTIADWQKMFASIYPSNTTEDFPKTFAKLTEEMGELAEAVRVFPAAPGYVLSEAADVFAWLMKLNNIVEGYAQVEPADRGIELLESVAEMYPARCRDCSGSVCTCPPILPSTIGRIAHEVSEDFGARHTEIFMTPEAASQLFGSREREG